MREGEAPAKPWIDAKIGSAGASPSRDRLDGVVMDWHAKWIWAKGFAEIPHFYLYARRELRIPAVSSARVHITCSSEYKLYVNGRYIGRGPSPCHPASQYYDTYDLSHVLRQGKNAIGVLCYNHGVATQCRPRTPGGLLMQLETTNGDGTQIALVTDESWKVKPAEEWDRQSSRVVEGIGFEEVYDSRLRPIGWNVVGFDDVAWERPDVIGEVGIEPWVRLIPRDIPHLRQWEVFPERVVNCDAAIHPEGMLRAEGRAAEVRPGSDTSITLDFGREVVGYPMLRIRDGGAGVVDFCYGERLHNGDSLILHGGRQEWQTFGRRAFRYMQLAFRELESPVLIECVSLDRIGYPVEQAASFVCSDDLLNEIWHAGVYTLSTRMQDSFEDCALGEHARDLGNARVQALINYYCFRDSKLPAKELWRFAPDCNLAWVMMLHDYYLHTGDRALVESLYTHVRLLLSTDQAPLDKLRNDAAHNAFYYQALRDASKLSSAVGEADDAVAWHDRAESAMHAFNDRFWCEDRGSYADCGDGGELQSNTLAVVFGLADVARCERIKEHLLRAGRSSDPYFTFYVLQAMAELGADEKALEVIRSDRGVAPAYYLVADVLGIKPSMPESDAVVIRPRPGDLSWAKGHLPVHNNAVDVEWHSDGGCFRIDISAPGGFIVGLPVERFANPRIEEIDLSPETSLRKARSNYGWGSIIWRDGEEHDPYVDWLRSQEEDPPETYHQEQRCSVDARTVWVRSGDLTHVRYEVSTNTSPPCEGGAGGGRV